MALYVSPHLDDAVLSCGAAIAERATNNQRVIVVTVCTGKPRRLGPFAERLHAFWGLSAADAMTIRRSEDIAAVARLRAERVHLGFLDAIYRRPDLYDCDAMLYGEVRDEPCYAARVAEVLFGLQVSYPSALWFAPLAIGNHVDHQIAYLCGRELARRGATVAFYEDIPYVFEPGRLASRLTLLGGAARYRSELVPVSASALDAKIGAVREYASQFADHEALGCSIRAYAAALSKGTGAERVWWQTAGVRVLDHAVGSGAVRQQHR